MRVTVKGLRRWTVYAAALLLAIVAGFFIYGRARFRHIEKDLPSRLGANIQQTANGFSYSQSSQGHTLFTIRASRLVQLRAGHALLHDVDITLYGPPGSGRADRIHGSDFDYNQQDGVATSHGEVDIEIGGIGASTSPQTAPESDDAIPNPAPGSNTIRVRTSGLTFSQKTGEASTPNYVEFQLPRAAGSSVGASFNSKSGLLVLAGQVHITTSNNGNSAVVTAAHATLLRPTMQAFLDNATVNYQTAGGTSDHATIWFRNDGSAQKIDAAGHVHMTSDSGAVVNSSLAHILLDPTSQPTRVDLAGGVQFDSAGNPAAQPSADPETMRGSAAEGTLLFTSDPANPGHTTVRHAQFRRQVSFLQQIAGLPRDPGGHLQRHLQAQKVDVDFVPGARGPAPSAPGKPARQPLTARNAVAEGAPVLTTTQIPSKGPRQTSRISGDHLTAAFGPANSLETLDATGNTQVDDRSSDGAHNTSRGDTLHATFTEVDAPPAHLRMRAPASPHSSSRVAAHQTTLTHVIQNGDVVLTETPARRPGESLPPATLTAWAQHADYRASTQLLHLTGSPRMTDSSSLQLAADVIDYDRDTQDASATGSVKATYTQQPKTAALPRAQSASPPTLGGSGPVHIIADRAELHHATSESTFYGTPQAPARMWQQTGSLMAPVITIDRAKNLLKARADSGDRPTVNATFLSAGGPHRQPGIVTVRSRTLVYSDADRRADFHGAVTATQQDGIIHCEDALVFLRPAPPARTSAAAPAQTADAPSADAQASSIDHILATGHVIFTQPGRRGQGNRLLYTAATGQYLLTGTPASPPHLTDQVHGTTTGEALIFNSRNDSVEVSGGKSSAVTNTRAPK